jgi:DNA invertase Pin-like site-specific DNA recombinase
VTRRSSSGLKAVQQVRCAIYTRKSTEEGLDQEFNSLDAQREACEAYVLSQRHEGWVLNPGRYDDGGYSGGIIERPSLQRLLADVRSGRVDVIVVYKVDRLTRSLADFAKIVEVLDGAGASFVSVTQAFNTTTSMGRLTLNVLLSFAQFEREVISERVRDKVAASKAKGIWMGGTVPLGYDVKDRRLVINEAEAETVRSIMRRYLELGSVRELMEDLASTDIRTKIQRLRDGSRRGGGAFTRGPLYHLLRNRIYVGKLVHHEKVYPGEHKAIVPVELFEQVQALLLANAARNEHGARSAHPSLLAGMVRDAHDRPLSPSHTSRSGRRYRYYVSNEAVPAEGEGSAPATRLAARKLEQAVRSAVADVLEGGSFVRERSKHFSATELRGSLGRSRELAAAMRDGSIPECRKVLLELDLQLSVEGTSATATCSLSRALRVVHAPVVSASGDRLQIPMLSELVRRGCGLRLVFAPAAGAEAERDTRLIQFLVDAHDARHELLSAAEPAGTSEEAQRRRDLTRSAKFTFLAPDIVEAILEGRQPTSIMTRKLRRIRELPLCWEQQRQLLGFA